jgi:signal transduction histidine kinase
MTVGEPVTADRASLRASGPTRPLVAAALGRGGVVNGLAGLRYGVGLLLLAAAYYAAGRASLALQYEGPVAAVWLPTGVGAVALYLAGLRWWPGLLIGDLALADSAQPLASALGITAGNMADMLAIALLVRVLAGPRTALDRLPAVGGMLVAITAGAVISATVASLSLHAGGVVESSELPAFWRSWLLADASGALVIIPLGLAWAAPSASVHGRWAACEGLLMIGAVVALSALSLSGDSPLTYLVFPALIWAALRFGARGATLAVAVAAAIAVGMTANEVGTFVQHSFTGSALSTQLYLAVAAVTTLCLAAVVSERQRSAAELAESRARIAVAAAEARRRVEGELHDSAQNRLFALRIRMRLAQEAMPHGAPGAAATFSPLIEEVGSVMEELRRIAQGGSPPQLRHHGLVDALTAECDHAAIAVTVAAADIGRSEPEVELAIYLCCLESIQNAAKHAGDDVAVTVRLQREGRELTFSIRDTGRGFDPRTTMPGAGLTNIRERVDALGGRLEITAARGHGTIVSGTVPWPPRSAQPGEGAATLAAASAQQGPPGPQQDARQPQPGSQRQIALFRPAAAHLLPALGAALLDRRRRRLHRGVRQTACAEAVGAPGERALVAEREVAAAQILVEEATEVAE